MPLKKLPISAHTHTREKPEREDLFPVTTKDLVHYTIL